MVVFGQNRWEKGSIVQILKDERIERISTLDSNWVVIGYLNLKLSKVPAVSRALLAYMYFIVPKTWSLST